jgi:predicted dehydrogenase
MNINQADEMLSAMGEHDRICPVNFVLRYNHVTDAVKAVLDSGLLGKPLSARLTNCASDAKLDEHHWFWDPLVSGGIFIEHGVHFFDLYRYWLGEGKVADAHTETREGTTQEDRVMCLVRHHNGCVAHHYHGFDQPWMLDRTDHRIVCAQGDIRVDGWIPLTMNVDAALDDAGVEKLTSLVPDGELTVTEEYPDGVGDGVGRGKNRHITKRVTLRYCPEPDKESVYCASVDALMRDQVAYLTDRSHPRIVTEENGRAAVLLAENAVDLAKREPSATGE